MIFAVLIMLIWIIVMDVAEYITAQKAKWTILDYLKRRQRCLTTHDRDYYLSDDDPSQSRQHTKSEAEERCEIREREEKRRHEAKEQEAVKCLVDIFSPPRLWR